MDVARQLSSWYKDETSVTIILVQDGTKYTLPKQMVCAISQYFARALEGDFKEADERTLKLPDCRAETFDVVLFFHMYQRLPSDIKSEPRPQHLLVSLWLFGDIYLIPHLKTEALKAASEILDYQRPCPGVLAKTLVSGPEDSSLRALFIEKTTSCIFQGAYTEEECAELAEIEGFFKIMADGLAAGKHNRVFADTVAQGQGSISHSPTSTASVENCNRRPRRLVVHPCQPRRLSKQGICSQPSRLGPRDASSEETRSQQCPPTSGD
ncbi:hypothetical protein KC327_g4117 [Hortaea werneckii]|uniref:BTB domain-containing protein n=1 Tax=Hortaea werneckii EXF-2000 TaxID=1157616 RepID=A0A1Z5T7H7_HORWE|nr:hypothetical protein KC358_g4214 [Hortaea werneckii]OTA31948.1 hypothetical protein BTJ68_08771 [Hortaea werneckii EXF-2000]KAI6847394.1 hypothetical protein KC350_g3468 [Hortaea werneckii]KAI6939603.1 hypothetical protein KC341_g4044 [Hortaea werneckii]KAI6943094.1 hypothetical protein KC348_g4355 [Hortaea werneckii]